MVSPGFHFDEARHRYTLLEPQRLVVPSTTQVLHRGGLVSLPHIRQDILENKRELGQKVHGWTAHYDQGGDITPALETLLRPYLLGWLDFLEDTNFKVESCEAPQIGYSHGMPFGMTPDRMGCLRHPSAVAGQFVDGPPAVIDIKCSAQWSRWWGIQLASYDDGKPHPSRQRRQRLVVQLLPAQRHGKFYMLHPFEDPSDYDVWGWALAQTWWKINNGYIEDLNPEDETL